MLYITDENTFDALVILMVKLLRESDFTEFECDSYDYGGKKYYLQIKEKTKKK